VSRADWYTRWFGDQYLQLYPHRDAEEARRAVSLVLAHVELSHSDLLLDLACGAGRHLAELQLRGCTAFGLDLSMPLLRRGRAAGLAVVRGDMRFVPFATGSFELVTSFFTSFGYFEDAQDDVATLREVRRVLRTEGWFALDYLNAQRVRESVMHERDTAAAGGQPAMERRALVEGERYVEKTIKIPQSDGSFQLFHERVRLYGSDELLSLLKAQKLSAVHTFGDYDGTPATPGSPRFIVLARAS
jgi:SAM-dependent methyltransferase